MLAWLALVPPPPSLRPALVVASARPRLAAPSCVSAPQVGRPDYEATDFDLALDGILADASSVGMEAALDSWLDRLDEVFIPMLASKVEAAEASEAANLPQLRALFDELQKRSQSGFERGRDQLQQLLQTGEITQINAKLGRLVRQGEIDAGFLYVLLRNQEDAEREGEEDLARLLTHLYTVTQEELEKKTAPALGLLHKLTRMDNPSVRGNLLREFLCAKTTITLPDGSEMPSKKPAPARVPPIDFASAVEDAIDKVLSLPLDRAAIDATVEDLRSVAKEARAVVEESYSAEELDAFTEALTPVFKRAQSG